MRDGSRLFLFLSDNGIKLQNYIITPHLVAIHFYERHYCLRICLVTLVMVWNTHLSYNRTLTSISASTFTTINCKQTYWKLLEILKWNECVIFYKTTIVYKHFLVGYRRVSDLSATAIACFKCSLMTLILVEVSPVTLCSSFESLSTNEKYVC